MIIHKVDDGLFRGPKPEAPEDFDLLKKNGVVNILSLESGWYEFLHNETNIETDTEINDGFTSFRVIMNPVLPPHFVDVTAALLCLKQHPEITYIHCQVGCDRTGVTCAAYRVKHFNWTADQAMQEMFDLGFHRYRFFWWIPAIKNILFTLNRARN